MKIKDLGGNRKVSNPYYQTFHYTNFNVTWWRKLHHGTIPKNKQVLSEKFNHEKSKWPQTLTYPIQVEYSLSCGADILILMSLGANFFNSLRRRSPKPSQTKQTFVLSYYSRV